MGPPKINVTMEHNCWIAPTGLDAFEEELSLREPTEDKEEELIRFIAGPCRIPGKTWVLG